MWRDAPHFTFDPLLGQCGDFFGALAGGIDGRSDTDRNQPRLFDESVSRPELAGVVRDRNGGDPRADGELGASVLEAARLAGRLSSDEVVGPVRGPDGCLRIRGAWQLYRTSLVQNNRHNRFHWADLNALDLVPLTVTQKTRYGPPRDPQGKEAKSVGVFVGASDPGKRPDAAFYAKLVRELLDRGLRPVLLGGPDDVPVAQELRSLFAHPALDLVGKLSLAELVAVGQTLGLFITPDTGPMHVAAWTGIRTLNLSVGNVNPWETGPYQPGHFVLRSNASCAHGCWACTRNSALCRLALTPSRVAALAAIALRGPRERMERLAMPGLSLFGTERTGEGLYWMRRLNANTDSQAPETEDQAGAFWRAFFLWRLSGTAETPVQDAWTMLSDRQPRLAERLRGSLPTLGKKTARVALEGLRPQALSLPAEPPSCFRIPHTGMIASSTWRSGLWKTGRSNSLKRTLPV